MRSFKKVLPRQPDEEVTGLRDGEYVHLINLTPHPISLYDDKGMLIATIPSDMTVRATPQDVLVAEFELDVKDSIPLYKTNFVDVDNMPEPAENTYYIVSNITGMALKARGRSKDILVPYKPVKDKRSNFIIGCRGFSMID